MFQQVFKANPNHDARGRFASSAFHGTNVADLIEKDGFKIMAGGNGQLLGEGIYLTSDKAVAEGYGGTVLEVDTSGLKIKTFAKEPEYKKWMHKQGIADFEPETMRQFMQDKGFDAVAIADKVLVAFDPKKLLVKGRTEKSDLTWYVVVRK